jgi:hypothetical protein
MTTNQGNDMASFNDETSVEDEALADREDEGMRDTLIDIHHSMVHQEERQKPSFASRCEVVSVAAWPS